METKNYQQFNQTVFHETLDNGMDVTLIPRQGFHKTYGILTTNYGAVDNQFVPVGNEKPVHVPDGIAHFLEHKMFEKADHDAFDVFGELGADANAFTSFTQTSYQFSTTQNVLENVKTLLDFVQSPYFSADGVKKEQGIIGQEIKMYNDNPDSQLYTGTIGQLYPKDPMHIDIAGTEESIQKITPQLLAECYRTFYQPANLKLVVVGNLTPEKMMAVIAETERDHSSTTNTIQRGPVVRDPNAHDVIAHGYKELAVYRPKAMVGIRGIQELATDEQRLKYKLSCELLLEMLFDDTTSNYLQMYNEGLIDDSFGFSFEMERGFHFATISSDVDHPEQFFARVHEILNDAEKNMEMMKKEFESTKRGALGRLIISLNSPEAIANRYSSSLFGRLNVFDEIKILRSISIQDLDAACQQFIGPKRITEFVVQPA